MNCFDDEKIVLIFKVEIFLSVFKFLLLHESLKNTHVPIHYVDIVVILTGSTSPLHH
jgi:hypothetical protein